jgi:hypothetical protein
MSAIPFQAALILMVLAFCIGAVWGYIEGRDGR